MIVEKEDYLSCSGKQGRHPPVPRFLGGNFGIDVVSGVRGR